MVNYPSVSSSVFLNNPGVAGGVAANRRLRDVLQDHIDIDLRIPPPSLCTDNGAMIAAAAFAAVIGFTAFIVAVVQRRQAHSSAQATPAATAAHPL